MLTFDSLKTIFSPVDAWLVGGGARFVMQGGTTPRDWDILVTDRLPNLAQEFVPNKFGGRKYPKLKLDVWLGDIGQFLRLVPRGKDGIAIHLATNAVLYTREFHEAYDANVTCRPVVTLTHKFYENGLV